MKTLLTIILTAIFGISYSQNYSLLNTNRQCLFNDGNYCLRIDSISASNSDTSYFNYKQISSFDGCFKYNHTSWLGKFVTKTNNNVWKFVNANDDTLILKPNLDFGAKWYAGNLFSDSDTAFIDSIYQTTFLGITDSVKSITVYSINITKKILISKNYGFVKFIDINDEYTVLTLAGITNPNIGLQNLSGADIFDFQVGDEYHTVFHNNSQITQGANEHLEYVKHTILSANLNTSGLTIVDSTYKLIKVSIFNFSTNPMTINTTFTETSSVQTVFTPNTIIQQFDKLPNENILDSMNCDNGWNYCVSYHSQGLTDGFKTKTTSFSGCYFGYNGANNCLSECLIDGMPNYFYANKMGGPYNYILPFWGLGFGSEYHPVFHKRGNVVEGTPIDFLSILLGMENKKSDTQIDIYPNPANDVITISNNIALKEFEIYNSVGLLVLKTQLQQINISNLANGFYHIKIIKNDNKFVQKQFVKQ
jgi:hypothetical protein